MAIKIPNDCYRQPTESRGINESNKETETIVLKGYYGSLKNLLGSLYYGASIQEKMKMSSASLVRNAGDIGTLTINCFKSDEDESDNNEFSAKALKEVWTIKSVRNDISILAYCGPSEGSNPIRSWIEAWEKEPDGDLANSLKYTKPDGTIKEIQAQSATADLIEKIRKGVDSVMRFYPQLTKTSTYTMPPLSVFEHLSMVDKPTVGSAKVKRMPGNLNSIISDHDWLKCQDDSHENAEGTWNRTESWIGVLKTDGGWDENLYGTSNRWSMPYTKM